MVGGWIGGMPGSLALVAQRGHLWRFSWRILPRRAVRSADARTGIDDQATRLNTFRYHLYRGRRAREAGRYEHGVKEAKRALNLNANDPWALALLGQCLHRQRASDLHAARRALEQAWALDPTNGYFVSLLLDVLNAEGDAGACLDLLTWAWWRGAPVERWLPDGPPLPACGGQTSTPDVAVPATPVERSDDRAVVPGADPPLLARRQSMPAFAQ